MEDILLIIAMIGFFYVGFLLALAWDSAIGALKREEEGSDVAVLFLGAITALAVLGLAFIFIG